MRKQAKKTGDFGIGMMIHAVHMTDDVTKLNQFYEDVFGGLVYMGVDEPNFLPPEDRWAGLIMISDLCIETMAPNTPVDATKPVGKFYTKFGQHLHSVGYLVDDLVGLGNRMIDKGVYMGRPGGGKVEEMDPDTRVLLPEPTRHRGPHGRAVQGPHAERPARARNLVLTAQVLETATRSASSACCT